MKHFDRSAWIALSLLSGIGSILAHKLVEAFGSPENVFEQTHGVLSDQKKISHPLAKAIAAADWKKMAADEIQRCERQGINVCTLADADYPILLKTVPYAPPVFYYRGTLHINDEQAIAVVGSRKPTSYGIASTRDLVTPLAQSGLTIVSGLAMGIDTVAHQSALQQGTRTIAVVAHGLDQVYPKVNRKLFERVIENGAVISEFRMGILPRPGHFPQRNRLISGLAKGVLVVEAGKTSGSLITARWAGEQNREIFAVPGAYQSPLSQGTHALIRDGAKLVTSADDILSELPDWELAKQPKRIDVKVDLPVLQKGEVDIYKSLRQGHQHVNQIAETCHKPVQQIMLDLLKLEMKGHIRSEAGQVYHWIGAHLN